MTAIAAVWLYTFRAPTLIEYIDPTGRHFHPTERVSEQPWWSVPATVAVVLVGAGLTLWLLPTRTRLIRRFRAHIANLS